MGDGDGWVICAGGHRHWGRFGAAGLLLTGPAGVVLQQRSIFSHEGGTWALPGGARDSHEDPIETALREAGEEAGIPAAGVRPLGLARADHGGWSYTTVVAAAIGDVVPFAANWESDDVRWWSAADVDRLPLHAGFALSWPALRAAPRPLAVIVDAANVIGSRPDGWWHDRAGAASRLRDGLRRLTRHGVAPDDLPDGRTDTVGAPTLTTVLPDVRLVVEGAAHTIADTDADSDRPPPDGWWTSALTTLAAPGSGDDTVVAQADELVSTHAVVVVTADRGLRDRLPDEVMTAGPRWLLDHVDAAADSTR